MGAARLSRSASTSALSVSASRAPRSVSNRPRNVPSSPIITSRPTRYDANVVLAGGSAAPAIRASSIDRSGAPLCSIAARVAGRGSAASSRSIRAARPARTNSSSVPSASPSAMSCTRRYASGSAPR